jgi:uncharacterized repeat protein (TIGR01451 family)
MEARHTHRARPGGRAMRTLVVLVVALCGMLCAQAATAAAAPQADSRGTDFWLAFPQNYTATSALSLFITGDQATSGTVEVPGLSVSEPFTVTPGTVTTVNLPSTVSLNTSDGVQPKGIHVTAQNEVTVYGLNRIQASTDAYLGLPTDVLGTEHVVLGWSVGLGGGTEMAVVGTQDGTTVTITPRTNLGSHPAGTPFTVSLNRGDAYQLISNGGDVSGTIIASDKPVAVFGGHQCANIPNTQTVACDHVVEQIPSVDAWGQRFITEPLATRQRGDTFRILAAEDNTQVSIDGSVVATLNRGEFHEQLIAAASEITADKPVLVAQYSNGTSFDGVTSDPFMMLVPPAEQFLASYTVTTPASGFSINYINLVVPDGAVGQVELDGTPVPASSYTPIGSTGFSGAQVSVSLGTHNLTGPLPFGAFMYGFDQADSYGYPGGLSVAPVSRVESVTVTPKTATNPVGTQHCVDATVRDQNQAPLPGVRVDFTVTGANPQTGFAFANASGVAQFCYTGANEGTDTIEARSGTKSDTATKSWSNVSADLSLSKGDSPDPVGVGQTLTYTLTVRNGGGDDATGVKVVDDLPAGPAFVSATATQGTCTRSGDQVTCELGNLANGASATVTIKITPQSEGTLTNTARVSGAEGDPDGSNNEATQETRVVQASLDCSKARATPDRLWPPNHKFVLVTLPSFTLNGNTVSLTVTGVRQDEPLNGTGDGDTSPDAKAGPQGNKVYLRAERSGAGDGRVYRISFTGATGDGGTCSGTVKVTVPHDNGPKGAARDSGGSFNSFGS